jgi:hypothetical protein
VALALSTFSANFSCEVCTMTESGRVLPASFQGEGIVPRSISSQIQFSKPKLD